MSQTVEDLMKQIDRLILLVEQNIEQNSSLMGLIEILVSVIKGQQK